MPPGALSEKTKASYLVAPAALGWGPLPPRNANWAAGRASGEQVCCSSAQGSVFTVAALLASLPWPGPLPWVPPPWPPRGLQGSVGAHRAQILLSSILARQPWAGAVPLTGRGDHLGPPCQVVEDQMWTAQRPARGQAGTGCGQSSSPPRDSLSPARHPPWSSPASSASLVSLGPLCHGGLWDPDCSLPHSHPQRRPCPYSQPPTTVQVMLLWKGSRARGSLVSTRPRHS